MKSLGATTLHLTVLPLLAIAQTSNIRPVKGTPMTRAFDISWVDNSMQRYYLADRSNNAIDLVDAATDTFLGFIDRGNYTGSRPCPEQPRDLRHCSGPNGVLTDNLGHVWAGDGDGNIIEADATKPATTVLRKIATGGRFRVDELAYDPIHQILLASNDGDSPVFLTFVSIKDGHVLGHYKYPVDQEGLEQPAWVRQTGWFYRNVPGQRIASMYSILRRTRIQSRVSRWTAEAVCLV